MTHPAVDLAILVLGLLSVFSHTLMAKLLHLIIINFVTSALVRLAGSVWLEAC
jgi:uncharacterized membrane-anchored protein YitT (DUF2179 family)